MSFGAAAVATTYDCQPEPRRERLLALTPPYALGARYTSVMLDTTWSISKDSTAPGLTMAMRSFLIFCNRSAELSRIER